MLTLLRTNHCPACDAIEESLARLSLARTVLEASPAQRSTFHVPEDAELPVLVDDGEVIAGSRAIQQHLERLKEFKGEWDKFQSDACYCDEKGEII